MIFIIIPLIYPIEAMRILLNCQINRLPDRNHYNINAIKNIRESNKETKTTTTTTQIQINIIISIKINLALPSSSLLNYREWLYY